MTGNSSSVETGSEGRWEKTMGRELAQLRQSIQRQTVALRRLDEAIRSGKAITADDPLVRHLLEATVAINNLLTTPSGAISQMEDASSADSPVPSDLSGRSKEQEQLLAICSVSEALNSTLDLTHVLNTVMDTIIGLTGAERGFIMLLDEETGELVFRTARNMDQKTITGPSFQISLSIVNYVAREGNPVVTTNAQADPRFSMQESVMNYSLRSILCVPLLVKEQVIGVIYADSRLKTGLFSERDLDVLVTFANQVASAIDNARLFESVNIAKNLMDDIFASIPSGVITTDTAGKISLLNRAAEKILGVSRKTCLGMPYRSAFGQFWAKHVESLIEQVMTKGKHFIGYEIELHLPERGSVTLSLSLTPLKDTSGSCQGVAMVIDDLTETRRLRAVREMFRRYVSPAVVDRLPVDAAELRLGGSRQEISILFADIRGFTSLSEDLPPEELVVILNRYLSLAAQAILAHEGTLDKFMGDAVMAIFNAPLSQQDHVMKAIRAALDIKKTIEAFHTQAESWIPHLHYGIGINVGEAVVGNIGTAAQMNYTAIGDTVNLAKRLQEVAQKGQILLSRNAHQKVADMVEIRELEPIQVKGRRSLEQVYELISLR